MTTNIYGMTDTWNNGSTVFTAIQMNVTDTSSDSTSLLMDLQVGGNSKFKVLKDGSAAYYAGTYTFDTYGFSVSHDTKGIFMGGGTDLRMYRCALGVLSLEEYGGAGGTLRTVATSPAQITADQDNYNPGGRSFLQRWSTDASRNVTGLTFASSQVDGEQHMIINVGAQSIVLKEQVTSTAANQFMNSTAADITLSAKQAAWLIYDGTTARWRVFKMN